PSEAAATGLPHRSRFRVLADLSLPRAVTRHAQAPDRYRTVQIHRVQAERVYQGNTKSRLLEEGPALSRRHRVYDHQEPVDGRPGARFRKVRHGLSIQPHGSAAQGREESDAAGDV